MSEVIEEELDVVEQGGGVAFSESNVQLDELYDKFNERFPIESLRTLTLEEYTNLNRDNEDYFCTWVERKMQRLGSIQGATSLKFGIYRYNQIPKQKCAHDEAYAWRTDLGATHDEAFENIRQKIVLVAEAANKDDIDFDAIDSCNLSQMFKWKIAFLYSRKRLLSIYSKDALIFLAQKMGMNVSKDTTISQLQKFLLQQCDYDNLWDNSKELWKQWEERNVASDEYKQYFVAKITDAQNVYEESVRNGHWRMQQRYDHETQKNAVTTNLTNAMLVRKGDVLLLDNGGKLYAYGFVKESTQESIGEVVLKDVIRNHKHQYFDEDGVIRFSDCEAYYERNYAGCNSDWSQYIDVEKWVSYCPKYPVSNNGVQKAAGLSVHTIFKVESEWALKKMRELDEHFDETRTETDKMIFKMKNLLEMKNNIILQGAPGTGKTYTTAALALAIVNPEFQDFDDHQKVMEEYNKLLIQFDEDGSVAGEGQIGFVTFHQSMDYEDFVEGIKPKTENGVVSYNVEDGIFKSICELAANNYEDSQKTEAALKTDENTRLVFERYCLKLEKELLENEFIELSPASKLKIFAVLRKSDGSPKSISISRSKDGPVQTLSLDIIQRDYPAFKAGNIASYEDIKPKYVSKSPYHGKAIYYYELLKKLKAFEDEEKISSKVALQNNV